MDKLQQLKHIISRLLRCVRPPRVKPQTVAEYESMIKVALQREMLSAEERSTECSRYMDHLYNSIETYTASGLSQAEATRRALEDADPPWSLKNKYVHSGYILEPLYSCVVCFLLLQVAYPTMSSEAAGLIIITFMGGLALGVVTLRRISVFFFPPTTTFIKEILLDLGVSRSTNYLAPLFWFTNRLQRMLFGCYQTMMFYFRYLLMVLTAICFLVLFEDVVRVIATVLSIFSEGVAGLPVSSVRFLSSYPQVYRSLPIDTGEGVDGVKLVGLLVPVILVGLGYLCTVVVGYVLEAVQRVFISLLVVIRIMRKIAS